MVGNRIKLLREELNISQDALAKMIGVSPSTIGMYETNKREPNNEILTKLSKIFCVSIDYLVGNSDKRTPSNINYDLELEKIGLSTKDLNTISEETKNEIKSFVEYVKNKEKK